MEIHDSPWQGLFSSAVAPLMLNTIYNFDDQHMVADFFPLFKKAHMKDSVHYVQQTVK